MNKKVAKEILKELAEKYPAIKNIEIGYSGAGDSFDDFWQPVIEYKEGFEDNDNTGEIKSTILRIFNDVIDSLWDKVGANFNNDGCSGSFIVDLENLNIKMDCYENYTEQRFAGKAGYFNKK